MVHMQSTKNLVINHGGAGQVQLLCYLQHNIVLRFIIVRDEICEVRASFTFDESTLEGTAAHIPPGIMGLPKYSERVVAAHAVTITHNPR